MHPYPAGFKSSAMRVPYSSLEDIWNQWTDAYQHASQFFSSGGYVLRYEDLVANPELEMHRVANHLGISAPTQLSIMTTSAKTHGESLGRTGALLKIKTKSYLDDFFLFQRVQACSRLAAKLMGAFKYHECDGFGGPGTSFVDAYGNLNTLAVQTSLWSGMDLPEDSVFIEEAVQGMGAAKDDTSTLQASLAPKDLPSERNVQVLGLQHTGTSLFSAMLRAAFGSRLTMHGPVYSSAMGSDAPAAAAGIWKHADIEALHDNGEMGAVEGSDVYALAMVRDPFSWLEAMHKEPLELWQCTWGSAANVTSWLTRACIHEKPGGEFSTLSKGRYPSVGGVWSHWVQSYEEATRFGFKKGLEIRYEDLIADPQHEMVRVAKFLGIDPPRTDAAELLAQDVGELRTRALNYTASDEFLDFYAATKEEVCQSFEKGPMRRHHYWGDDCHGVALAASRPYLRKHRRALQASISPLDFLTEGLLA